MATKLRKKHNSQIFSYKDGETKVKIHLDNVFLDTLILYVFTKSKLISKANLLALRKLLTSIDETPYLTNSSMIAKLEFLSDVLECKLEKGIERENIVLDCCRRENDPENRECIKLVESGDRLSANEIKAVTKSIGERLKYLTFSYYIEIMRDLIMRYDTSRYDSLGDLNDEFKEYVISCLNDVRKAESNISQNEFSLKSDIMEAFITELVKQAQNPALIFKTGIRCLNDLLSPGFHPGRLYLFLGITGGYKSSILLQCAKWIKLYNPDIVFKRKDNTALPTILLITTENSVEETVIRLWGMGVTDNPIGDYTPEEAIRLLREEGKLCLTDDNQTDIMLKYYANNELTTGDLYGVIEDIENDNREVIALIFDYIKRIRPSEKAPDERLQLKNVSNELKTLAIRLDIPVITANQINRAGNMAIDAAASEGKEDLARMIGRANVSASWDLLENVDWAAIINLEREKRSGRLYLTFKRIKIRYKDMAVHSYMNHPFEDGSTLRLIEDLHLEKSVSIESMSSNMEGVNMVGTKGVMNAHKREVISNRPIEDAFDFDGSIN